MKRTKPPFRADHVGSLLRPAALKEAREQARQGRDQRRRAQGGRGPRDRAGDQEAGGGRAAGHHRRRVPPLLVAPRLPLGPRRRRAPRDGAPASRSPGVQTRAEGAHRRQARLLRPPDDRAFQVRGGAHQAHAEDHDPGAVGDLRPHRRRRRSSKKAYPVARAVLRRSRQGLRARRCAPSPMPAAATCSSTRCSSPCCAIRTIASADDGRGDDPRSCRRALRRPDQHRDVGHPLRHDDHDASVPRQLQARPSWAAGGYEPVHEILFDKINVHGYFMEYDRARRRLRAAAHGAARARPWCSAS